MPCEQRRDALVLSLAQREQANRLRKPDGEDRQQDEGDDATDPEHDRPAISGNELCGERAAECGAE